MPNLTVTARDIATGDAFDIASDITLVVHRVDPIGYSHVRIAGTIGETAVNPDPAATAALTLPADQDLYITRRDA